LYTFLQSAINALASPEGNPCEQPGSSPEGRLAENLPGTMAEFSSRTLGKHTVKALDQRAHEGKHAGGIPFGYQFCWADAEKGERRKQCDPEHPGGVHVDPKEGPMVTVLFRRSASGMTTLSQLASRPNGEGFRTRHTKKLPDQDGQVSYKGKLLPGEHKSLVSQELFDTVQAVLKKNSGRSETPQSRPERDHLLKGIIRCAYCWMPMWSQTFSNGQRHYREHKGSRSHADCEGAGGSTPCRVADDQIGRIVGAIELRPKWLEEVLAIVSLQDEVQRVKEERSKAEEKVRRMAKACVDNLFPDEEYHRQKRLLDHGTGVAGCTSDRCCPGSVQSGRGPPKAQGGHQGGRTPASAADYAPCGLCGCQSREAGYCH
jgi:site-specific DNA recombinase